MQRQQYKQVIQEELSKKVIDLDRDFQLFRRMITTQEQDYMFALLIEKIGLSMTLRIVDMIASKAVTDADTYLGPDVFTEEKFSPFAGKNENSPEAKQYSGAYYFQRYIFPIEFRRALIMLAEALQSKEIAPDKPMQRIEVAFNKREQEKDPDELRITFWTAAGERA